MTANSARLAQTEIAMRIRTTIDSPGALSPHGRRAAGTAHIEYRSPSASARRGRVR